jgi:hypothetical protein
MTKSYQVVMQADENDQALEFLGGLYRPPPDQRLFTSKIIDEVIVNISSKMVDQELGMPYKRYLLTLNSNHVHQLLSKYARYHDTLHYGSCHSSA